MKTIIISSYDDLENPDYAGGGAVAVQEVAKRLSAQFKVIVITGRYPNSRDIVRDGVFYTRVGTSFLGPKLGQLMFSISLPFLVLTKPYDIWIESFTPPFSTAFLPLFTKKPVIGLAHMLSAQDMKRKYKLPFQFIENMGVKLYSYFIVLTDQTAKRIKQVNNKAQVELIPNGVNLPSNKKKGMGKHLLFLGRIEVNQKGLDLLLDAFSKISDEIDYPLYIAGSGQKKELAKLIKIVNLYKLSKKVRLLGKVTGKKKERAYRDSLFLIVSSRLETFSMAALEAMSYKRAVVGFDIEGLSWMSKENSIKVKPFDTQALSETIARLCALPDKTLKMGSTGYSYAKKYEWTNVAKKYQVFISQVLKERQYGKVN